jgi:serine-type D-Ala-D-Ala carboxypeptidase (penicillin-binding protein 5/6)
MLASPFVRCCFAILLLLSPAVLAANPDPAPKPEGEGLTTPAREAIMIDLSTDTVLLDKAADQPMPTSSMSKMMTLYLAFDALKQDKLKPEDQVTVSEHAWRQEGSRMFLPLGSQIAIKELIPGVAVQSGNDASVALAEAIAGSEPIFAERMNAMAKELGMSGSRFMNATGLPHPDHYSTARDLAKLGAALYRDFPEDYKIFSQREFTFNGIKQGNRNPLLYRNLGADGIKTGHAEAAGYGMVAMAERQGRRLVLVVNGLKDMQERADETARLIEYGFHAFGAFKLLQAGDVVGRAKIWLGTQTELDLTLAKDVVLTLPVASRSAVQAKIEYEDQIAAPISKGQGLGKVRITVPAMPEVVIPLVAANDVPQLNWFSRVLAKAEYWLLGSPQ